MGADLAVAVFALLTGFVAAGILGSFYQLVTHEPPSFKFSLENWFAVIAAVIMCAFAGPFIIMRNAIRGRRIENRPVGWLAASTAIAGMWSLCSGIVVLDFAIALTF
ncbi:MAG: hypothetical protein C0606_11525 [Hyphomicrobiales bacterium]|nr:MAG: hypothetical protein C0606_11525 [Hyphomicrobiales bacterium]